MNNRPICLILGDSSLKFSTLMAAMLIPSRISGTGAPGVVGLPQPWVPQHGCTMWSGPAIHAK